MNKKELIKELSSRTIFTQQEIRLVIDELKNLLRDKFLEKEDVLISGLGKFEVVEQKPRPVRNPKTKEEMMLKPYPQIKFRVSTNIKNLLKKKVG